jgi:hypothetical protein
VKKTSDNALNDITQKYISGTARLKNDPVLGNDYQDFLASNNLMDPEEYAKKAKIEGIDFLSTKGKKILHSFIHMHCNRLLGIDPSIEEKSILFAAETIKKSLYVLEKEKNFHPY